MKTMKTILILIAILCAAQIIGGLSVIFLLKGIPIVISLTIGVALGIAGVYFARMIYDDIKNEWRKKEMKSNGSVIVSWDFSNGRDIGVILVGKQVNGKVEIVNAFQGKEAVELYEKLIISNGNLGGNKV